MASHDKLKKVNMSAWAITSPSIHDLQDYPFMPWGIIQFPEIALGLLADLKETREVLQKHVLSWGYKYYKVVIGVMVVIPKMEIGNYET